MASHGDLRAVARRWEAQRAPDFVGGTLADSLFLPSYPGESDWGAAKVENSGIPAADLVVPEVFDGDGEVDGEAPHARLVAGLPVLRDDIRWSRPPAVPSRRARRTPLQPARKRGGPRAGRWRGARGRPDGRGSGPPAAGGLAGREDHVDPVVVALVAGVREARADPVQAVERSLDGRGRGQRR
ncbi:hypothetical protein BN6_35510 [Saccharothrix espanaensis DSM 44229]|uniref:Uncharacterized protein n=1 Tax=Saccharothrix espanaensis (strain ATCC 51144 / DSM 44229 / JCM 9112 / NBRC 15066 / NRRL 15764) TaxID=1179773 RepID=K0K1W0_SACES|nr:hypothetical protein BN6_35510 [Saccharothrix espanaensis DSM 44229]